MKLSTMMFGKTYQFKGVIDVLAKANEEKSGDRLAGIAAESVSERIAAKAVLSQLLVSDLRNSPAVPYEQDEVTRVIQDGVNETAYGRIKNWSISELREYILSDKPTADDLKLLSRGLSSEVIAGVAKLMTNLDLVFAASKFQVEAHCNTTIGRPGTFSSRLQPNHTTDDPDGVMVSMMEGLSYGIGDAVIGLNPVDDSAGNIERLLTMFGQFREKWKIPTQNCVLAHITTQMECVRRGAPADLCFQSIAGSQKGNEAFGISVALLDEANALMLKSGTSAGPNVMYFETGQGSELSSDAHFGADQVVMEARCYGLARRYRPYIVNTVVGFIGPEYLYNASQVIRAGLEDHFMGKLSGLPMGCDACYTNHMKADQNEIENLAVLLGSAGCTYLIGVPCTDDIMLNYQSTGFHEIAALRQLLGKRPIREFEQWCVGMGFLEKDGRLGPNAGDASVFMK